MLNLTASALNGVPSWKTTPLRSLSRKRLPVTDHSVANRG